MALLCVTTVAVSVLVHPFAFEQENEKWLTHNLCADGTAAATGGRSSHGCRVSHPAPAHDPHGPVVRARATQRLAPRQANTQRP